MSHTITDVVDTLAQAKIQASLHSLDAICGDCPEPLCAQDPRACPVSDARRALTTIFFADWVEPQAPMATGGCGSGGCSTGGCGRKG